MLQMDAMKISSYICVAILALFSALSAQSIEDKIGDQNDDSIRAKIGNRPTDVSHTLYTGTYGTKFGLFALQWYGGNKVRGSFFDSTNSKEVRLYGDNSVQGRILMEGWTNGQHTGTGPITKSKNVYGLSWSGTIFYAQLLDFPVTMHKYEPKGEERLTSTSNYSGKLGKTNVRISLNWYANGRVRGQYTNVSTRKSYDLRGYNYANGKLYLDEWDSHIGDVEGGVVTARITLSKVTVNGRVQWQGRMFNMDKRNFAMSFARTGSTGTGSSNKDELEKKLR